MAGASGKKLDETYKLAWLRGLKTTYYLRTLAATQAEKSTGEGGELNAVSSSGAQLGASSGSSASTGATRNAGSAPKAAEPEARYCKIDDPSCEACQ
jgi:ribonucleoside-diphosphate reductase alpha chain